MKYLIITLIILTSCEKFETKPQPKGLSETDTLYWYYKGSLYDNNVLHGFENQTYFTMMQTKYHWAVFRGTILSIAKDYDPLTPSEKKDVEKYFISAISQRVNTHNVSINGEIIFIKQGFRTFSGKLN